MSETLSCTTSSIDNFAQFGFPDACHFVREACADQTNTVDFFSFYYCDLNQNLGLFIPFSILLIFLIFYAVSSTAEDYLEPTVAKIARKLRFSESLAGVTLVALANGAADVIAAFAAGGNIEQGVLVPLGGLLGAGIFTISIILAVCILFSRQKTIRTESQALVRDCGFYLFGVLYVLGLGFYGEINLVGTIGFLVQYAIFIAVVLYQEAQYRKEENRRRRIREKQGPSFTVTYGIESVYRAGGPPKSLHALVKEDHVKIPAYASLLDDEDLEYKIDDADRETQLSSQKGGLPSLPNLQWRYALVRHKIWHEFQDLAGKSVVGKVFYMLVYPLKIARDLTIPASNSESWEKWKALIQPFALTLFLIWQFGFFSLLQNPVFLGIYLALCCVCSISVWKLTANHEVPEGPAGIILMVLAFAASVTWINLVANILVDFIALLAVFTNLPLNFLGLTLVAFGGSTPDFFVDLTLARKGLGQTAASGIFAGQYFNVGIGFGIALTRQVVAFGPRPFSLIPDSNTAIINLILIGCLIGGLVIVLAYGLKNQFVFKKGFAFYSLLLYSVFLASVTVLSFK